MADPWRQCKPLAAMAPGGGGYRRNAELQIRNKN
jgi:hypothetical protein